MGCKQFLYYNIHARNALGARSIKLQASTIYQTRNERNVLDTASGFQTIGLATLTVMYATRLIFPQEQQEEEIKRGREEQRNANQMRREQMRKEAEHAHEQTSSQALRKPESKERLKQRYSSSSGPDQHGLEGQQEQHSSEDPSDDAKCNQGGQ